MTMRLDIVTNDAGDLVRREHARELGAGVVLALYRLARQGQLHDLSNQAFTRQLEQTHEVIGEYCLRAGGNVNILFAGKGVFVAGQLLKGARATYEAATELAQILERCGGSELFIARDVTEPELLSFAESISATMRAEKGRGFSLPSGRIRLRAVGDATRLRGNEVERLPIEQRIVRNYATAVVVLRGFFDDLAASRYVLPRRIKRIAQNLVDLSAGDTPAFLGVTEARNANHDAAGQAVNAAILSVAVAREVTSDRGTLAQIAMAAMMHDVGRPRAIALANAGGPKISQLVARLSEDSEDKLPGGTAAVITALGRVNEPSITRTVIAFESLWLRRASSLGPVYRGARPPTLHARIVAIARRYNDLLTPEPGLPPPPPDAAIATLASERTDSADRTVLRMLVAALGLFPVGTVVQLSTDEIGEVVPTRRASLPGRPTVRLSIGVDGAMLASAIDVDLARAGEARRIARVLSIEGWKKGRDVGRAEERVARDSSSPSRSAVVPSEGRAAEEEDPSLGTSPSAVAQSMGRMLEEAVNDSIAPATLPPPVATPPTPSVSNAPPRAWRIGESSPPPAPEPSSSFAEPKLSRIVTPPPLAIADLAPTARGGLGATPLAHVLVYMLDHALTGSIVFHEAGGVDHVLHFQLGAVSKVQIAKPTSRIGDELVGSGLVSRAVVNDAVEGARRLGLLLGEYLIGHDLVTREALAEALETQIASRVAAIVNLPPETTYAYYRDVDLLPDSESEGVVSDPLNVILATVRAWNDRARIRATLSRIAKHRLVFHELSDPMHLTFTPEERKVIDYIRAEAPSASALFQAKVADEEEASSLLYALAVTRQFAFKGQKGVPMGGRGASIPISIAPPAGSDAEGLEIPPSSAPPKFTAPDFADHLARASAPPEQATRTSENPPLETAAERAIEAMTQLRLAETALERNDLAQAERFAARAVANDPYQSDYVALHTWIRAMMSNRPESLNEAILALSKLLSSDPKSERALLYRGKLLKKMSRIREALRDFERLVQANPRHREGVQELRLLRQRATK